MNKNSNTYIIVYSTIMVVVVAAVLAIAAMVLQPKQNENIEIERKSSVLASVGLGRYDGRARGKTAFIENEYAKYIKEIQIPLAAGDTLQLIESNADGRKLYVVPLNGSGLWGPIWGYVAVEGDWSTISGVVFDHKGETPGLGDKIITPKFRDQFVGKRLFEGADFVGITVLKGKGASRGNDHAVDAVTGGTITSRGVENMIRMTLEKYLPYIERQKSGAVAETTGIAGETAEADGSATGIENTNNTVEQ
jgi:Na+-transporting NADH:ubiquinone oxidoreductase subunit C